MQSAIRASGTVDYGYHPRLVLDVPQHGSDQTVAREYTYPLGIRIKPVEFESNQKVNLVNYTAKAQLVFSVPYSEYPIFWWHAATGVNRPFFPLVLYTGYSRVEEIRSSDSRREEKTNNRWDSEVLYSFPLMDTMDFRGSYRVFNNIENGKFLDLVDLGLNYYFTNDRKLGMDFSYQKGALPPEFKETTSFRIGLLGTF